jgi:hypothetical protein
VSATCHRAGGRADGEQMGTRPPLRHCRVPRRLGRTELRGCGRLAAQPMEFYAAKRYASMAPARTVADGSGRGAARGSRANAVLYGDDGSADEKSTKMRFGQPRQALLTRSSGLTRERGRDSRSPKPNRSAQY